MVSLLRSVNACDATVDTPRRVQFLSMRGWSDRCRMVAGLERARLRMAKRRVHWRQVVALYDQLHAVTPTPVVALNRAVALGQVEGPAAALAVVDGLDLDGYHAYHATRADLLRRLGRHPEAVAAYDRAVGLTANPAEQALLITRRDALT